MPSRLSEPLKVALVNNMPDSAFADTEAQFLGLLSSGHATADIRLRRYTMCSLPRGAAIRPLLDSYQGLDAIYDDPPDALIISGTEPRSPDLRDEPYWQELRAVLEWSQTEVPSVLLSCLAAHAASLALDDVQRVRLPRKCCGVFAQQVDRGHPLTKGIESVSFPHSRLNEVPTRALREHGYDILLESPDAGWTVAVRERSSTLTVMFQGHPEYAPDTLLREYRRDLRRYAEGERPAPPDLPIGYLDQEGDALLSEFSDRIAAGDGTAMTDLPFDEVLGHVATDWRPVSRQLMTNWLSYVKQSRMRPGHQ
jgi:homoserine O-succinyltransferase/O-acetyltransferase